MLLFVPERLKIVIGRSLWVGRSENDSGDIEVQTTAAAGLSGAGVREGGKNYVLRSIVASPATEMRELHGDIGSRRHDLVHKDPDISLGVPNAIGAQVDEDRHAEAIGGGEYFAQCPDLGTILEAKGSVGEMQFESATKPDSCAVLDAGNGIRTRWVDTAEAEETLRILPHLGERPVILRIYGSGLIGDTHERRSETVGIRECDGASDIRSVQRGGKVRCCFRFFLF